MWTAPWKRPCPRTRPCGPNCPTIAYYEDMVVQAVEHFPGIALDLKIRKFMDRGGVIVREIVPTGFEAFQKEDMPSLAKRLETFWKIWWGKGIDKDRMIAANMNSPATCCLVNPDKELTVERAFGAVDRIAERLSDQYLA